MLVLRHFRRKLDEIAKGGEQEAETGVGSCYMLQPFCLFSGQKIRQLFTLVLILQTLPLLFSRQESSAQEQDEILSLIVMYVIGENELIGTRDP